VSLFHLAFVSKSCVPITSEMLEGMQKVSERNNSAVGITGLTLTSCGHFMEILEGDAAALASLYSTICKDRRHTNVRCVLFAPAAKRLYPEWALGVYDLDAADRSNDERIEAEIANLHRLLNSGDVVKYSDIVGAFATFGKRLRESGCGETLTSDPELASHLG